MPNGVEWLIVTSWESWDAVRAFAGDDPNRARFYPDDARYFVALDERVEHYELVLDERWRDSVPAAIGAEMDRIAAAREETQPIRSRTGGSTFKNPPGHKAWALIDAAGCRGMTLGGAQVSEKHCNFLLNLGSATSADIEALGEEVRRRVQAKTNISLEWEIQRIGTQ